MSNPKTQTLNPEPQTTNLKQAEKVVVKEVQLFVDLDENLGLTLNTKNQTGRTRALRVLLRLRFRTKTRPLRPRRPL